MSAIAESAKKKSKKKSAAPSATSKAFVKEFLWLAFFGAALGLSAPGINQWYLAWIGVAPLVISIATSEGIKQAFLRGLIFGTAYNLVYGNWMLGLQPLTWLGFNWWQGGMLATTAWLVTTLHQGIITGLFAGTCRLVPMVGGFLPKKTPGGFGLPALITIPLLWVLMHHLIGNAHDALGIPWSMLEYSQYKQINIIQMVSVIGGIGLCFLMVMWNTAFASVLISVLKKKNAKMLNVGSNEHAFYQLLFATLIVTAFAGAGFWCQNEHRISAHQTASVLQGNINIDMQKTRHRYTLPELWRHYEKLASQVPPGLCVWSEGSLPTYLRFEPTVKRDLCALARRKGIDMVVGSMDHDPLYHPYNAAYGVTSDGTFMTETYYKRYLVPFGEYAPMLVHYLPEWIRRLTNTPAGGGYTAGKQPVVYDLPSGRVAPLICFETLSPELVASSVRKGGQLLVNVSDLAWFHDSIVGRQMLAFAVIRAVENKRCLVFAANTGPSAIIDQDGYIQQISPLDKADVLTGRIGYSAKLTPFTRWFVF